MVVGVDVGGPKKGYHAVALDPAGPARILQCADPARLAAWCADTVSATVIAVDAPCRWASAGTMRLAERELAARGVRCFPTPPRDVARRPHPTGFYDWMLSGEALYEALAPTHPVPAAWPPLECRYCFETFPHAIAWHLRGGHADAKKKREQRRQLLVAHGVALRGLTNLDWLDAALCALAARTAATGGPVTAYGDAETGWIVLPAMA